MRFFSLLLVSLRSIPELGEEGLIYCFKVSKYVLGVLFTSVLLKNAVLLVLLLEIFLVKDGSNWLSY